MQLARDTRFLLFARVEHPRRKLAQIVLALQAPRDVAQDYRVEPLAVLADLRDRGLDRKLLAVGAQAPQHARVAHAPVGDAGAAEPLHVRAVRRAEARGDELFQSGAERVVLRAAEQLLRRAVELHDALRFVDRDDGVHRRVHDGGEPRLGMVERRLRFLGAAHLPHRDEDERAQDEQPGRGRQQAGGQRVHLTQVKRLRRAIGILLP